MRRDLEGLMQTVINGISGIDRRTRRWKLFEERLKEEFPTLLGRLGELYGADRDVNTFIGELIHDVWKALEHREDRLIEQDLRRAAVPDRLLQNDMVGAVCYVDLFAGTFDGLRGKIPYLQELGINYIHLMPCYKVPTGKNDGGYAVSSYRDTNPRLGTIDDLRALAKELRENDIALSMDFVLNHTADDHDWAEAAKRGDPYYKSFYYIINDEEEMNSYARHLRDIFPQDHPGSFTYKEDLGAWVWTTFNVYQWDLNYRNHEVFRAMCNEMMFLMNLGAEILRFDAVAFIWKQMGTRCESLPQVHTLIAAFKQVARLLDPLVAFNSEAIVHPDEVVQFVNKQECELSYNPLIMATSWEAVATRDPALLRRSLAYRSYLPEHCSWVNYVRCHDDIGWTFDDGDAWVVGIDASNHRHFLNNFFTGNFAGSFSRGLPFQENPVTGDCRISGSCASLAGLEKGVITRNKREIEFAIRKILMLHGISATIGGIPLIYLGDEIAMLNDYSYLADEERASDSRWVHRPQFDWKRATQRQDPVTIPGRVFPPFQRMLHVRKDEPAFSMGPLRIIDHNHRNILGFARMGQDYDVIVLCNFSDELQTMGEMALRIMDRPAEFIDLLTDRSFSGDVNLEPWEMVWLKEVRYRHNGEGEVRSEDS